MIVEVRPEDIERLRETLRVWNWEPEGHLEALARTCLHEGIVGALDRAKAVAAAKAEREKVTA